MVNFRMILVNYFIVLEIGFFHSSRWKSKSKKVLFLNRTFYIKHSLVYRLEKIARSTAKTNIPYQNLINLYLTDCVAKHVSSH